jgi:hypothetical protein
VSFARAPARVDSPRIQEIFMAQGPELPPPVAVLQLAAGRWISHIVGVAAELGLADQIQSGPKTAEELARAGGLNAGALLRLLRALASLGIFAEQSDGRFAQTPMSDALRSDVPYSMRGMARMVNRPWTVQAWTDLEHAVRSGQSAFEHVHGTQAFDYMVTQPKEMEIFANAMSSFTAQVGAAIAESYDFSGLDSLADVGGSHGTVLTIVLNKSHSCAACSSTCRRWWPARARCSKRAAWPSAWRWWAAASSRTRPLASTPTC